jgi:hypothetical protein
MKVKRSQYRGNPVEGGFEVRKANQPEPALPRFLDQIESATIESSFFYAAM